MTTKAAAAAISPILLFFGAGSSNGEVMVIGVGAGAFGSEYAATLTFACEGRRPVPHFWGK